MHTTKLLSRFSVVLLVSVAMILSGCGDGRRARVKVSGHVTVDGKLLKHGGICFRPTTGGRMGGGGLGDEGQYSTTMYKENDGLPPGSYTVAVNAVQYINDRAQRWHAPKSYSDHKKSGLTVEITEETTDLDFDLSWEIDEDHSKPWVEKF